MLGMMPPPGMMSPFGMVPIVMPPPAASDKKEEKKEEKDKVTWKEQEPFSPVSIKRDTYVRPLPSLKGDEKEEHEKNQARRLMDVLDYLRDKSYIYGYKVDGGSSKETHAPKAPYIIHTTVQVVRYARHLFLTEKDDKAERHVQVCTYEGDNVWARFDFGTGFIVKTMCDDGEDELGDGGWTEVKKKRDEKRRKRLAEVSF